MGAVILTPSELASRWGVSVGLVQALARSGQLPYVDLGSARSRRFRLEDVLAFEEARRSGGR